MTPSPVLAGRYREVRFGEVNALAGLRHPGLVELLDVGADQGRPFCVMTLVHGPTLAERLERGPMPLEALARVGSDLAATLAYVHGRGVLHRDVKPANVILAGDGRARLADFGIAQLVDATASLAAGSRSAPRPTSHLSRCRASASARRGPVRARTGASGVRDR